jgi:EPS-associated MarR family transcriptional regulator
LGVTFGNVFLSNAHFCWSFMEILRQSSETREDLGLLAVMEALEEKDEISQRELARVTGLNLKKVNYCLHKLLEKGHVKFQRVKENLDKRSYLYILTPAGLKAKSRLTYRFLKVTFDFYGRVEEKLKSTMTQLIDVGVKTIVLSGKSDVARILVDLADEFQMEIVAVLDQTQVGGTFAGVPVFDRSKIDSLSYDAVVITDIDDSEGAEEDLRSRGIPDKRIWSLS